MEDGEDGEDGESLDVRGRGQVWTPTWMADAMAAWAARDGRSLVDPAAGSGRLLRAAAARGALPLGVELDPAWAEASAREGLGVVQGDFLSLPLPFRPGSDWSCNPPYLRHRLIAPAEKARLHARTREDGLELRGTVGLHAFFVHAVVRSLHPGDRAALLLPSDLFEGASARGLLPWMLGRARLEGAVLGEPGCGAFDGLDLRPLLLLLEGCGGGHPPGAPARVVRVGPGDGEGLARMVGSGMWGSPVPAGPGLPPPWLPRPPSSDRRLGDIARVTRGLVAGHAGWALHTRASLERLGIPERACRRVIRRASDVGRGAPLTDRDLDGLDARGVPTFLISLSPAHLDIPAVREHVRAGEAMGLPDLPSLRGRNPWWKPERRETPRWLFSYFGSPTADRFVRNLSSAAPLMGHLCISALPGREAELDEALSRPDAALGLTSVAKCHGKSWKAEPGALARMPLPPFREGG